MTMTPTKGVKGGAVRVRVRTEGRTRTEAGSRTDTRPRPDARPGRTRGLDAPRQDRARSAAAQRGYARKAQRRATGGRTGPRIRVARRTPFVLLVMAMLAAGLVTSLWLSTAAAGDSYRLQDANREARDLTERAERLRQEVAAMQTAPQLAERARGLGMVPAGQPAVLIQRADGTVEVVGEPTPATAPAPAQPPPPPVPAPDPNQPAAQQPPAGQPGGQPVDPAQPPAQPAQGQQPPPAGNG